MFKNNEIDELSAVNEAFKLVKLVERDIHPVLVFVISRYIQNGLSILSPEALKHSSQTNNPHHLFSSSSLSQQLKR